LLQENPEIVNLGVPSLDTRMDIISTAVPDLAKVAAAEAIAE
jgi:hypothetical protein